MRYTPFQVYVEPSQEKRLKRAIEKSRGATIVISFDEPRNETLLFTKDQIEKIERAGVMGNKISIRMSAPQVKANTEHHGGFLWSLAARLAPAILSGIGSAVASKVTSSILKKGEGLYLQKNGHCAKVQLVNGGGLYLAPHPRLQHRDGLFETDGTEVKGKGLLLGDNSPFKSVPLLNLLL